MCSFEPRVIVFLCNWCSYEGADAAGRSRREFASHNLREIRVMCSGRVDPQLILEAFSLGADGVMILGCAPGDCHYRTGNAEAMKRIPLLERVLQQYDVEKERMKFDSVSAGEGEKYARIVSEMVKMLRGLGPLNHA